MYLIFMICDAEQRSEIPEDLGTILLELEVAREVLSAQVKSRCEIIN